MFFSPAYTFKRLHFLHSVINAEVCFCTSADCWFCFSGKANCWGAGWGALESLHWSTSENPGQPRPSPQVSCPRPCWALINTEFSDERIRLLLRWSTDEIASQMTEERHLLSAAQVSAITTFISILTFTTKKQWYKFLLSRTLQIAGCFICSLTHWPSYTCKLRVHQKSLNHCSQTRQLRAA